MIRMRQPLRVALVGIDGSGKSTVARQLCDPDLAVIHTIHPDETVDGPFHELSEHLQVLSTAADRLRSPQLKIAAFYLLLQTFAPTERFFTQTFAPHTILSDRHPLIDAMVYLPLYHRRAAGRAAQPLDWIGELEPETHRAILTWAHHIGCTQDLWTLGHQLLTLHTTNRDKLLIMLCGLFHTSLPDVVIHLDLEVDEALHRVTERGRSAELHETAAQLSSVRDEYEAVLHWLDTRPNQMSLHRIDCGAGRSVDDVAAEITNRLGARVLSAVA